MTTFVSVNTCKHKTTGYVRTLIENISDNTLEKIPFRMPSDKYGDYQMSILLKANGYTLDGIITYNDVEWFVEGDIHYLKAELYYHYDDQEYMMTFYPRYVGSDEQWELLMMDTECEDLVVRLSYGQRRLAPLWVSVFIGGEEILLTGERLDWNVIFRTRHRDY